MSFQEIYLTAAVFVLGFNTILWVLSLIKKDSSIIDPFWSILFLISCAIYLLLSDDGLPNRQLLLMTLVTLWAVRLAGYLFWRNWGEPEDFRYQQWRENAGAKWWWRSYFKVFVLQGVLAWIISVPLLAGQYYGPESGSLGILDGLAVMIWLFGFYFEAMGDWQLARFKADPANKGKLLNTGVWRYTRHPNYFGDAAQWWAFYLIALAAGGWWTIYAPMLMTGLLLRVSGVAMLEKTLTKTKPEYQQYIETTPAFLPWFPKKPDRPQT